MASGQQVEVQVEMLDDTWNRAAITLTGNSSKVEAARILTLNERVAVFEDATYVDGRKERSAEAALNTLAPPLDTIFACGYLLLVPLFPEIGIDDGLCVSFDSELRAVESVVPQKKVTLRWYRPLTMKSTITVSRSSGRSRRSSASVVTSVTGDETRMDAGFASDIDVETETETETGVEDEDEGKGEINENSEESESESESESKSDSETEADTESDNDEDDGNAPSKRRTKVKTNVTRVKRTTVARKGGQQKKDDEDECDSEDNESENSESESESESSTSSEEEDMSSEVEVKQRPKRVKVKLGGGARARSNATRSRAV